MKIKELQLQIEKLQIELKLEKIKRLPVLEPTEKQNGFWDALFPPCTCIQPKPGFITYECTTCDRPVKDKRKREGWFNILRNNGFPL